MPITIHYTDDNTGVNFYSVDRLTGADIIEAMKELMQNENFANLRYLIVDRSLCTEYAVTPDEVRQIADIDRDAAEINPGLLQALISNTDLQYGMSRMYEIHSDNKGFKTRLFRDRASAEKWIEEELDKD